VLTRRQVRDRGGRDYSCAVSGAYAKLNPHLIGDDCAVPRAYAELNPGLIGVLWGFTHRPSFILKMVVK